MKALRAQISLLLNFNLVFIQICEIYSHGYLANPPARSSAWREDPRFPRFYDDNQMYCGGRALQWQSNG